MKYVSHINEIIRKKVFETNNIVIYGENVNAGSCLSGLSRGIKIKKENRGFVINTPNSENAQVGIGFGLMMNNVSSIFFFKQQDFLLLGIDHLVNTHNFIKLKNPSASYTIITSIVDNGYQGLQSSLNNFGDFCSIARIDGFTITNKKDAEEILDKHLISPGFRIIGVSQRLFNQEIIDMDLIYSNNDKTLFKYSEGTDATIVCFNLSFPYGVELGKKLKENNISYSLFSVNSPTPIDWEKITLDVKKTRRLIIIDDSKSENLSCYNMIAKIQDECKFEKIMIKREFSIDTLSPNDDLIKIDYKKIVKTLIDWK